MLNLIHEPTGCILQVSTSHSSFIRQESEVVWMNIIIHELTINFSSIVQVTLLATAIKFLISKDSNKKTSYAAT